VARVGWLGGGGDYDDELHDAVPPCAQVTSLLGACWCLWGRFYCSEWQRAQVISTSPCVSRRLWYNSAAIDFFRCMFYYVHRADGVSGPVTYGHSLCLLP
jgi:hypothetical protein